MEGVFETDYVEEAVEIVYAYQSGPYYTTRLCQNVGYDDYGFYRAIRAGFGMVAYQDVIYAYGKIISTP